MSLTLNDEQEKALREWYNMDSSNAWKPWDGDKGLRLARAIAPLMKPWRVSTESRLDASDKYVAIVGPRGEHLSVTMKDRNGRYCWNEEAARRICDALNKSEP